MMKSPFPIGPRLIVAVLLGTLSLKAQPEIDFAIYDDRPLTEGTVWSPSLTSLQALLDRFGYTHETLSPLTINESSTWTGRYRALIVPGGWAGGYNFYTNATGYSRIRSFVFSGGGYLGFCAGAFFASDRVEWQPEPDQPVEFYDYPLNLFPGVAFGTVDDLIGWETSTGLNAIRFGAEMIEMDITDDLPWYSPERLDVLYYGGSAFRPTSGNWGQTEILARYPTTNEVAMIRFAFGSGTVFLSGVHPEISLDATTDRTFQDPANQRFLRAMIASVLGEEPIPPLQVVPSVAQGLEWTGEIGFQYQVEGLLASVWTPVGDPLVGTGETLRFDIPPDSPATDWRVVPAPLE